MLHPNMSVHALPCGVQTVSHCIALIHSVDDIEIYWERYWQVPLGEPRLTSAAKRRAPVRQRFHDLAFRGVFPTSYSQDKENTPPVVLFCGVSGSQSTCSILIGATRLHKYISKEIKPVHPKGNQPWVFIGRTDAKAEAPRLATWCEEPTHWKRSWCWERLRARGKGGAKGWDDWMESPTQWTWVWSNSGR